MKSTRNKKKANAIYKIYISSCAGLDYTGVWTNSEKEAKALCDKYNAQDPTPYCQHVYRKQ